MHMLYFLLLQTLSHYILGYSLNSEPKLSAKQGYFWQVTDFHLDRNYSTTGDVKAMCHKVSRLSASQRPGPFGNYKCDAPLSLVESAVKAMKHIQGDPDFILWTGDSVPHVPNEDLDIDKSLENIAIVTQILQKYFSCPIYPLLGNHDAYPSNQFPGESPLYYVRYLKEANWSSLIPGVENWSDFERGGYYAVDLSPTLKLVALNTNMYYQSDKLTSTDPDPAGQFSWMKAQLDSARKNKQKVLLAAHIGPGMFERVENIGWFTKAFNAQYLAILRSYSDVVLTQLYGHEHTDSFRSFRADGGVYGAALLAPAVTPWNSTLVGAGYNNPGVRLFTYAGDQLLTYTQYYADLTAATTLGQLKWGREYSSDEELGLADLSAAAIDDLAHRLTRDDSLFTAYLLHNSVSVQKTVACDSSCRRRQVCAITAVDYDDYGNCTAVTPAPHLAQPHKHTLRPHNRQHMKHVNTQMKYVICGLVVVVIVLFVIVMLLCCTRRSRRPPLAKYHRLPSYAGVAVNTSYTH